MNPSLITLILNIALGVFILLGFLFGLKGIKKSTYSLVVFIVQLLTTLIITPIVSKAVLTISISGKTINQHIIDAVNGMLGEELASTSLIQDVVAAVPIMVASLVVAMALLLVLTIVFKILGAIVYHIAFRKEKEKFVEECQLVNGSPQMVKKTVKKNKHRLFGGLIGAVHGFIFAVVFFFPICGVVNIFNDVAGVGNVSAEVTNYKLQSIDEAIQENMPKEVLTYAKAIDNSIIFKLGKVGNISELSFNIVSKANINGVNVRLGEEIRTLAKTYNSFVDFVNTTPDINLDNFFEDILNNPENYDFDKLNSLVDTLFNSNFVNAMGKDALVFVGDLIKDVENPRNIVNYINNAFISYAESDAKLKEDIKAAIKTFEVLAKSGLVKEFQKDDISFNNISNILLNEASDNKTENEVLNNLTRNVTSSTLLQKLVLELMNYGIDELEIKLNDTFEGKNLRLTNIDSKLDITIKSEELNNIAIHGIDLYEKIESINFKEIKDDIYNLFDADAEDAIKSLGLVINDIVNISVLKDTGVFASLCNAMAKTDYNKYVNFDILKDENVIIPQFENLAKSLGEIQESGIVEKLRGMTEENQQDRVEDILSKLAETDENQKTTIERIVAPLLECNIFKNVLEYGLDEAHKYIQAELIKVNPDAELTPFNTKNLLTEDENEKVIGVLNNLVQFANGIDVANILTNDFIDDLLSDDNNLNNLGLALNSIKASNLFADYASKDGTYKSLMNALSGTDFADYFDFNVAKEDDFDWEKTTTKLIALKQDLDSVEIDNGEEKVKLLKYILTNGDYNNLLDNLNGQEVKLTKLFELDILKPTSIKVINIINQTIKDFVDKDLDEAEKIGINIVDIDTYANIADQSQSINQVINKALALKFDNINLNSISESDLTAVENFIDALYQNAEIKNEKDEYYGVFRESCNALLIKVVNTINEEVKAAVGNTLGASITMLTGNTNIINQKSEIVNALKAALEVDLTTLSINEMTSSVKDSLDDVLNEFEYNSLRADGVFKIPYNSILLKIVNLINTNIKEIVGEDAGSKINETGLITLTTTDVIAIRNILNGVIDSSKNFKNIEIKSLDIDAFFNLVDLLKNNQTVAQNAFAPTYNALLVYSINTINSAVATETGAIYSNYNGNITVNYNYTREVLETGKVVFNLLTEQTKLENLYNTTELTDFLTALNVNEHTQFSYNAIQDYLKEKLNLQ